MTTNPSVPLRLFEIQNGLVIGETGQQDADDFAADFQGLRHFADRVGKALDLGSVFYAALHEPDFTFLFLLPPNSGEQANKAAGAMISSDVSNYELLLTVRERNS